MDDNENYLEQPLRMTTDEDGDPDSQEEQKEDALALEEARSRIEDAISWNTALITPTKFKNSPFHNLVTKEFKISNMREEDVKLIQLWQSLANMLLTLGMVKPAALVHAELTGFLAVRSSVDGFERKMLVTNLSKLEKLITSNLTEKQEARGGSGANPIRKFFKL